MKKIIVTTLLIWIITEKAPCQITLFEETFANNQLPPGWLVDSAGSIPVLGCYFGGPPFTGWGFDNHHLEFGYIFNDTTDLGVITSSFDPSMLSSVYLSYAEMYEGTLLSKIEVSNNNGNTWNLVSNLTRIHGYPNPTRNVIDITSFVAGQQNVKIKFHFITAGTQGLWYIDSVRVSDQEYCNNPADSGYTTSPYGFACTGSPVNLSIAALSRGIGQTYQWQYKNTSTGNVYTNIAGAVYDTLNGFTQNGNTYYQCTIMCQGDTAYSKPLQLNDIPNNTFYLDAKGSFGSICIGTPDTLSLLAQTTQPGISYQWAHSPGINWASFTNITGATNDYYVITDTNTIEWYYACKQVCLSNNKYNWCYKAAQSFFNPNPYCYCIPFQNNICGDTTGFYGGSISAVSITGTTLFSLSSCNNVLLVNNCYTYFPASTATLNRNTAYTFNVTTDSASITNCSAIWIDYDRNGNFDDSEFTLIANNGPAQVPCSKVITIPANATPGLTGMRVRSGPNYLLQPGAACGSVIYGETEDYMITIDSTVGIAEVNGEVAFSLYPNPTRDKLIVGGLNDNAQKIVITNGLGAMVWQQVLRNDGQVIVPVETWAPGIYAVCVKTQKEVLVKKFVKE